jgi:hypothetical protein
MNENKSNKIEIHISKIYLFAFWSAGWLFTLGITAEASYHPTFWDQFIVATLGYILWPGVLGLYIAKLLGTY